ncbi:hypothetical protein B6N60_01539 [Richelia sinica FACHB-800]|uniref:Uncharacterized protein n=1 Tax=Richelia sinica FACHB-800 TaxID=1357546 RepID=A0A975T7G6_9NOST|nr:hypothetical protein B6N60_01539 [Richelia sinica FACHB-800]
MQEVYLTSYKKDKVCGNRWKFSPETVDTKISMKKCC